MAGAKGGMFANLGPALARLRSHRGQSQAAVARAAGIGKSQLSKYESGKELPKMESLERVLAALGLGQLDFFYTLLVVDRGDDPRPAAPAGEPVVVFDRLMSAVLALYREIVVETDRRGRREPPGKEG
ncbi:MAG TPA: helix-turn-helix transcriptional regulator [Thermoanaerobaculia bacterium]|nr:helix-turn-helix transcriptional regulator [Thermoanaerobaculia bacterium]